MKNLTIILSYDYPPNDGGISRLTAALALGLSTKDISIEVCTLQSKSEKERIKRPSLPTVELSRKKGWREIGLAYYLLSRPRKSRIITTVWNPEASIAWLLGRHNFYVLAHGNEVMPYQDGLKSRLKNWLRVKVLSAARCVICNSSYTEKLVKELVPHAVTTIINPGVDYKRFSISYNKFETRQQLNLPSDKFLLLSVSRIDKYKGHDVVLSALARLPKEHREKIHYIVAGQGQHQEELKRRAIDLGVADIISWLGFVDDEKLPLLYKACDLFVLCTREDKQHLGVEGFGMVFLEAQAAGLAVVGTNAGGIPDAIHDGHGGWLIPQDDHDALVTLLRKIINEPKVVDEQGRVGRERVQNQCTWQNYNIKLIAELDKH